jgi:hypothetical protein
MKLYLKDYDDSTRAGPFHDWESAREAKEKLQSDLDLPLKIVQDDESDWYPEDNKTTFKQFLECTK